ncbi:MAG: hypothetical protein DRJ51_08155 [Thermoprotei archaeon]|nr:MAG: hypothetical protein DRJ51_08155 [Thermoprotei archaeon]
MRKDGREDLGVGSLEDEDLEEELREFVYRKLLNKFEVVSVILIGSRARGDSLKGSDVDLLVILERCDMSYFERVQSIISLWKHRLVLNVFPYTTLETIRLTNRGFITVLDALEHGVIIYDNGFFSRLREKFREALKSGIIARSKRGWWKVPTRKIVNNEDIFGGKEET